MRRHCLLLTSATALIGLGVLCIPAVDLVRGASLVARAAGLDDRVAAALATFDTAPVTVEDFVVPTGGGPALRARLYRPARPITRTVVLTPGVHAEGIAEPRLVKFARDLAAGGFAVVTPELPDLLRYEVTPRLPTQIAEVARWAASRRDLARDRRVGLVGISFSGGMSVVAAANPEVERSTAFVLSFGGHGDLARTMNYLCTGRLPDGRDYPPHDYGVAVILLNYAPFLVAADQVEPLRAGIRTFLKASHVDMVDKPAARAIFAAAVDQEAALPEPARGLLHAVNRRDVALLGSTLVTVLERVTLPPEVSPERSPAPRVPVFLLHGADDNVIPASESISLAAHLRAAGAQVELLVTPLVTHAEVDRASTRRHIADLVFFWMRLLST